MKYDRNEIPQKNLYIRLIMIKNVFVFNDGMGDIYLKING